MQFVGRPRQRNDTMQLGKFEDNLSRCHVHMASNGYDRWMSEQAR